MHPTPGGTTVTVRFWAGARAAAGGAVEEVAVEGQVSLADLVATLTEGRPRLVDVIAACSVLIDERPAGTSDPAEVSVRPGNVVDFLPPFAGG